MRTDPEDARLLCWFGEQTRVKTWREKTRAHRVFDEMPKPLLKVHGTEVRPAWGQVIT